MACGIGSVTTDRGRRIRVARRIQAPVETTWRLLSTVERWPDWGPAVTDVDCPNRRVAPETEGSVQLLGSIWAPFAITAVENRSWTWQTWGRTPPADGHRAEAIDGETSRVVLELPVWAAWYVPLCSRALRNLARLAQTEIEYGD